MTRFGFPDAPQITPCVSRTTNRMVTVTSGPRPPAHSPTSIMVCTSSQQATSMKEEANSRMKLNLGHFLSSNRTRVAKITPPRKYPRDAFSPDMAVISCPFSARSCQKEMNERQTLQLCSQSGNVAHAETHCLSETRHVWTLYPPAKIHRHICKVRSLSWPFTGLIWCGRV